MFKKYAIALLVLAATAVPALANVTLHADTAPNVYGSPLYAGWRDAAFAAAANDTFIEMQHGAFPGTHIFAPEDAIVYSTGTLGKRLHWVYWIEGVKKADLAGRFEVKDVADWGGVDYTYDWSLKDLVVNTNDNGWIQPGSWIDYDKDGDGTTDGVIGTFGNAWWAVDDQALPYSTDGNPYNETDAADIAAQAARMRLYQTHWTGLIRYRDSITSPWQVSELRLTLVPAPGAIVLGMMGLGLIGWIKRRMA